MIVLAVAPGPTATAQPPGTDDRAWRVRSTGSVSLDGGLVMASPAALGTGLSIGAAAGVSVGRLLAWGVRASWSSASESSLTWSVTQADFKLRLGAAIQRDAGRGRFALRLGVGPTMVRETRLRNQGVRAGLSGSDLQTSATQIAGGAEVEAVIAVHIAGPWLLSTSAGPSLTVLDGDRRLGWTGQVGIGWQR
jgi:hypothetical protein